MNETIRAIDLLGGIGASVVRADRRDHPIFWFIDAISINLPPSHPDYASLQADTTGASVETGDELRFSLDTGELVSGYLKVPELNEEWTAWKPCLESLRLESGALVLRDKDPFILPQTHIRVFDPGGGILVCVMRHAHPSDIDSRCEVLPGFSILSSDGQYIGWALDEPVKRLCSSVEELAPVTSGAGNGSHEAETRALVRLFGLINESTMDELYEGSDALAARLAELGVAVRSEGDSLGLQAIYARIEKLYEWWFE